MENKVKTGTTIVGIVGKDCVVLAADMRTTAGYQIVNDRANKVFLLNDSTAAAQAGSVSANQMLIKHLRSELKLLELKTLRKPTTGETVNMLRNWIYGLIRRPTILQDISTFLIGGQDAHGLHLYECFADGSLFKIDGYISSGSGSVYAIGVLESQFKKDLSEKEAVDLAVHAVDVAMQKDIASGNGIKVVVINKDGAREVLTKHVNTNAQ